MSHVNSRARFAVQATARHRTSSSRRRNYIHGHQNGDPASSWGDRGPEPAEMRYRPRETIPPSPNRGKETRNLRTVTHPDGSLYCHLYLEEFGLEVMLKGGNDHDLVKVRTCLQQDFFSHGHTRKLVGKLGRSGSVNAVQAVDGTFLLFSASVGKCFDRDGRPLDRRRFWECVIEYPTLNRTLPAVVEDEFVGALAYGVNSHLHLNDLSGTQTPFPLTLDQIQRITEVYYDLRSKLTQGYPSVIPIMYWHIARVMAVVAERRQATGYGTLQFELYRKDAVPSPTLSVRLLDSVISLFLLGVHGRYRKSLRAVNLVDSVSLDGFTTLMNSLLTEWADTNLLGSVFLSANVAFQTIEGVNHLQRTASLASAVFSILSIASGIHHVWFHRYYLNADMDDAAEYLSQGSSSNTGNSSLHMTPISCFLALPLSMMLWAVVAFTVAISAFSIQFTRFEVESNLLMIAFVSVAAGLVLLLGAYFWRLWKEPRKVNREDEYNMPFP